MSSTSSNSQSPSPELTTNNNTIDPPIETTDPSVQEEPVFKDPEESSSEERESNNSPTSNPWQAIFSPQHNAYYFYNTLTNETTWINPLQPEEESGASKAPASAAQANSAGIDSPTASTSKGPQPESSQSGPSSSTLSYAALQAAAVAQGIDPSLAYLDPSLAFSSAGPAQPHTYTAKFNARTGAFSAMNARDPGHLSEYERAKRMSEFYFDVGAWEKDVAERKKAEMEEEEAGRRKRKRPTKQDLERFKEQKKQKKIAKTAWLRN